MMWSFVVDIGRKNASGEHGGGMICCNCSQYRTDVCYLRLRTDVCYLRGDVRTYAEATSIFLHTDNYKSVQEKIRPYMCKWEQSTMNTIDEITLKIGEFNVESCQVQHDVPAIVFSTSGYTGNLYHEFNDGLIPLYITSQHLNRQVVFVILEYQSSAITPSSILARISESTIFQRQ